MVDGDPRTHRICEALFADDDLEIVSARTGQEALASLSVGPVMALITELTLSDMDGLTLVRRVRDRHANVVAVVLTSAPSARTASQAIRVDIDDYVIKDADSVSQLHTSIRRAMRRRAHQAESERLLIELTEMNESFLQSMATLQRTNMALEERLNVKPEDETWRILVVDDELGTTAVLEALLSAQGYQVETANSGAGARALFLARPFDVVLTDKNLGDADGVVLAEEIRVAHPATRVLLMTGYATLDSAVNAVNKGVVGYLRKPFSDLGLVLERVQSVLNDIKQEADQARYHQAFRAQNAAFLARFRMLKTKLATLQRSRP